MEYCLRVFGEDFYIECAPSNQRDQVLVNKTLQNIAKFLYTREVNRCILLLQHLHTKGVYYYGNDESSCNVRS